VGAAVLVFEYGAPAQALPYGGYASWISGAAVLLVSGGIAAAWFAQRARAWALIVRAAAGFFAGQVLMLGHEPFGREKAGIGHLAALRASIAPQTLIHGVEMYEYALPFYLGAP